MNSASMRERFLRSLTNPITITAVLVVLINDHWLRWQFPSWFTGKIGDFAWLVFAPFLLLAIPAVIFPRWQGRMVHIAAVLAFIFTGAGFALVKTVFIFHQAALWILTQLSGWQPTLLRDPTDLLMLLGLFIGWMVWQQSASVLSRRKRRITNKPAGWLIISLAAVATTATSPAISSGIQCVTLGPENQLYAFSQQPPNYYQSYDGGVTWEEVDDVDVFCQSGASEWMITDPANPGITYRYQVDQDRGVIEQSSDGIAWQEEYTIPRWDDERLQIYYAYILDDTNFIMPTSTTAVADEDTGNIIISMGVAGALLHTPDGEWKTIPVGPYRYIEISEVPSSLLLEGVWLPFISFLALLVATILLIIYRKSTKWFVITFVIWGEWLLLTLVVVPFIRAFTVSIDFFPSVAAPFYIVSILFLLLLLGTTRLMMLKLFWRQIVAAIIVVSGLFLLPYIMWVTGRIPSRDAAILFSTFLAIVGSFVIARWFQQIRPELPARTPGRRSEIT